MQTNGQTKKPASSTPKMNPFAKAMAEVESHSAKNKQRDGNDSLFNEAMAKTGGSFADGGGFSQEDLLRQQEEMRLEQERQALHKKQHDKINPVDQHEVFAARKEKDLKEIKDLKGEIQLLIKDLEDLDKESEKTLMTQIADPGDEGSYYKNFFAKLRSFIMLLRQKVQSAKTWASQMNAKKRKMARRQGVGLVVGAGETKAVHDTFHHERSNAYSGA